MFLWLPSAYTHTHTHTHIYIYIYIKGDNINGKLKSLLYTCQRIATKNMYIRKTATSDGTGDVMCLGKQKKIERSAENFCHTFSLQFQIRVAATSWRVFYIFKAYHCGSVQKKISVRYTKRTLHKKTPFSVYYKVINYSNMYDYYLSRRNNLFALNPALFLS